MKLIIGLGNPGREYESTRHNVGWWALDHLAGVWHFDGWRRDGDALVTGGKVGGTAVRLLKPLTFMNLSGAVLKPYLRRPFWAPAKDLLVIVDEVALPLGTIRYRPSGSAGGHNGLKSIEQALGNQQYSRLRIGIRPEDERRIGDLSGFVLSPFAKDEREILETLRSDVTSAVEGWLREESTPTTTTTTTRNSGTKPSTE